MSDYYPYQDKGIEHLLSNPFGRPHALLADAPGTGKTVMTIGAAKKSGCKTGLIICPAIIKEQWRREMIKWGLAAEDEIQVAYGQNYQFDNRPWGIINYDIVRIPEIKKQIAERKWHLLTLDEAHRLKTHDSKQTHAVFHKTHGLAHHFYYKWALSGTIMPNRPVELYPLLKTLAPEVLGEYDTWPKFLQRYCGGEGIAGKGASHIKELTEAIQPFMLRRELQDVWRECPPVIENVVWLDVPYKEHPEWAGSDFMMEATERRIIAEAKAPYTAAYLRERLEDGGTKIVVFTYHKATADYLEQHLAKYKPVKIYGGISLKKREESLAKFTQDPSCRLFLLQIVSGGEGLDGLQHVSAEYVEAEPEWSPGREDQAGRRVLRLGQQSKVVLSTQLLVSDSYEEIIYNSNQRKRKVIDVVLKPNGGNFVMSIEANLESLANSAKAIADVSELLKQVLMAAVQGQQAPLQFAPPAQVPPAPFVAPQPQMVLTAPTPVAQACQPAQTLPVATVATAASVPAAPSVIAPACAGMTRDVFEKQVLTTLQPLGPAGMAKLQALNATFGIGRLGELPEAAFPQFLSML